MASPPKVGDNEETLANENNAKPILQKHFGCKWFWKPVGKQTYRYTADFYGYDDNDELEVIIEYRRRSNASSTYKTLILDVYKWNAIRVMAQQLNIPFIFAVEFNDGLFFINETNTVRKVKHCERTEENFREETDSGPCIQIPIKEMTRMG